MTKSPSALDALPLPKLSHAQIAGLQGLARAAESQEPRFDRRRGNAAWTRMLERLCVLGLVQPRDPVRGGGFEITEVGRQALRDAAPFAEGEDVVWLATPPGGWGVTNRVDAKVLKLGTKRIKIRVADHHANKRRVEKRGEDTAWVTPDKLQRKSA